MGASRPFVERSARHIRGRSLRVTILCISSGKERCNALPPIPGARIHTSRSSSVGLSARIVLLLLLRRNVASGTSEIGPWRTKSVRAFDVRRTKGAINVFDLVPIIDHVLKALKIKIQKPTSQDRHSLGQGSDEQGPTDDEDFTMIAAKQVEAETEDEAPDSGRDSC
jgi:hypothetical protein